VGDLDGAVATLDLDGNSSRVFSRSSCLLWLPLLDRCWRHVTALLLLLAICPTVMGWNSLGMPYIPSTFCIIFSFLLRSKHVYHHVLHLGLKCLCITMGHCIPCKNHGTLYSYHMYACLFFSLQLHVSVFFLSELHTLVLPLTILLQNIETRNHYHAIHCHLPLMVQHNLVPVFAFLLASSCWSGHVTPCAFTSALQSCTPMLHQLLTSLPLRPCLDHLGLEFSPD